VIWTSAEEKKNEEVLQVTVISGDKEERLWSFQRRRKGAAK
jgi:c-di-GMP-binding flagellar brake protein YcgR